MTVYIVMYYFYDDTALWGVYSTEELAQAAIDGTSKMYREYLTIERWEVDEA